MTKPPNKLLYIGAGTHIEPVNHFKNTKEFVFIDTQPRSEYDSFYPKFEKLFYKHTFYSTLVETCWEKGFMLEHIDEMDEKYYKKIMSFKKRIQYFIKGKKIPALINPTLFVFRNTLTEQVIHYYISTNIQFNMNPILQEDIQSCDGIIVSGYHPTIELLQYIKRPIDFFGYSKTNYVIEKTDSNEDKQNIIYFLQTSPCNSRYYFKDFFVMKENGKTISCTSFQNFVVNVALYDDALDALI